MLEIIRPKYGCRNCEEGVKIVDLPKTAIPKSVVTPGTLSHIILSKYEDHMPLYRQEKIFQRMGVDIPKNTLCTWVMRCGELLTPLYKLLKQELLKSVYIQADETPVRVLKHEKLKHYMWVYLSRDKKILIYDYHQSRSGAVVRDFLNGFKGLLQTDGYSGYNQVLNIIHAACWAHVRRKYVDIIKNHKKHGIAKKAVELIGQLYAIERAIKYYSHEERKKYRQSNVSPILNKLKNLLNEKIHKVLPKSPLGRAITYNLKLWDKLIIYLDYGQMEVDTNLVENSIRPFALGRRNWLFKGSTNGARASSIIYSLLLTCRYNLIEPYAYMKYVLYKLPKISEDRYIELLPTNINTKKFDNIYNKILY